MQNTAILQADVLDIIFEGRNKEYGAYELRRTYNKRMNISLAVMLSVVLLFVASQLVGGSGNSKDNSAVVYVDSVSLANLPEKEPPPLPPPPVTPPPPAPKIKTIQVTPPKIVPDEEVKPEEQPPLVADMEDAKIDVVSRDGVDDVGIVGPPAEEDGGRGIIDAPRPKENPDSLYISVQIESSYPGGTRAWQRFLYRNLRYPQDAADNGIHGTVMVQFIVDKEGNVSGVQAISGPEELRPEAERVIRKSGKWTPAVQNGIHVKSYKRQPIGFKLLDE